MILDASLLGHLRQHRSRILNLQATWSDNIFVSKIRFDSHIQSARAIVQQASACQTDNHPLTWISLGTLEPPGGLECLDEPLVEPSTEPSGEPSIEPSAEHSSNRSTHIPLDTDVTLLNDFLGDELDLDMLNTVDVPSIHEDRHVELAWSLPVCSFPFLLMTWADVSAVQESYTEHPNLIDLLRFQTFAEPLSPDIARVFYYRGRRTVFNAREIDIMGTPGSRLNDGCINGIAAYLHEIFSRPTNVASAHSRRCALFSTFDLVSSRCSLTDDVIWRSTRLSEYWSKDIWILPIHRTWPVGHWVMCTILPHSRQLFLFDSFAERLPWKREIKEIMVLVTRLVLLSNQHGHHLPIVTDEGWTARPVLTIPRQTNNFDCGLFVLANIACVLHGFHSTSALESDMLGIRQALLAHILHLPPLVT